MTDYVREILEHRRKITEGKLSGLEDRIGFEASSLSDLRAEQVELLEMLSQLTAHLDAVGKAPAEPRPEAKPLKSGRTMSP